MTSKRDLFTMMFFDSEYDLPPNSDQVVLTYNAIDDVSGIYLAKQALSYITTWNKDREDIPFDTLDASKRITHWMYVYPPELSDEILEYKKKKYHKKCMSCKHYASIIFSHVSGRCSLTKELKGSGGSCAEWKKCV